MTERASRLSVGLGGLIEESDEVVAVLGLLEASEDHLGARDELLRVLLEETAKTRQRHKRRVSEGGRLQQ